MKGKYCLVYWLRTKQITVLSTKDIPAKKRNENVPIKLLWKDEGTNKTTSWDAKILRFDDDADFLNSLIVDEDDGTIISSDEGAGRKKVGQKRPQLKGDAMEQKKQRSDVFTYEPPQELSQQPSVSCTYSVIPEPSESGTSRVIISYHDDNNDGGEPAISEKEKSSESDIEEISTISPVISPAEAKEIKLPKDQLDQQDKDFKPEDSEDSGDSDDSEDSDEEAQSPNHHHQCPLFPGMGPPTREIVEYFKAITQSLELWLEQEESKARE